MKQHTVRVGEHEIPLRPNERRIARELSSLAGEMDQPLAQLREIRRLLSLLPRTGIDWPKLEKRFDREHPAFRVRLRAQSPDIPSEQISLAILLRLELEMPEIAQILHLSQRATAQLRRDLRLRLDIPRGRSERAFLKAL